MARLVNSSSVMAVSLSLLLTYPAVGDDTPERSNTKLSKQTYSPYASLSHPSRLLWGDAHVHTNLSMDAGIAGNVLPPATAYRYARGEQVQSSLGLSAKLSRPLDWIVIADHTDGMGLFDDMMAADPEVMAFEQIQKWNKGLTAGGSAAAEAKNDVIRTFAAGEIDPDLLAMYSPGAKKYRSVWESAVAEAENFNEPGRFTALIGYEWTSVIDGNNMHRVVIMRDGAERALQLEPFTMTPPAGSPDPRDLWNYMDRYEKETNGRILAIPHNGNLSNGYMFPLNAQWNDRVFDSTYVEQRLRLEPLYEVTQMKGDSESHSLLSPDDEFSDFETWDKANLDATQLKANEMLAGEYAREALKRGLIIKQRLGVNPYKFGLIGATDSHTSLAAAEEENFFGKNSVDEPSAERANKRIKKIGDGALMNWETSASGITGVWATDNSREAIFDAMLRKEVYATTGPRITLRVFGGWDFGVEDLDARPIENVGYEKGVPMGGDFRQKPGAAMAPTFMIVALRDPGGANLDRIQIVKGWLDGDGRTWEELYDVSWSGERVLDDSGKLPPVGNTVNVGAATWSNTIGAAELSTVWVDPDFHATQNAYYYVRVLEIPTPRWTTYDAYRYGVAIAEGAPLTIQERAYSSPIWYHSN